MLLNVTVRVEIVRLIQASYVPMTSGQCIHEDMLGLLDDFVCCCLIGHSRISCTYMMLAMEMSNKQFGRRGDLCTFCANAAALL